LDLPTRYAHRAPPRQGDRQAWAPRLSQVPLQASPPARDRSAGKGDALAVSLLRREIAYPLDVVELDCAETSARGREPAPDHPTLESSRRAPKPRAVEACSRAPVGAPFRKILEHGLVVSRNIGEPRERRPDCGIEVALEKRQQLVSNAVAREATGGVRTV